MTTDRLPPGLPGPRTGAASRLPARSRAQTGPRCPRARSRRMWEKSNSTPMRNRSRIRPIWLKLVSEASSAAPVPAPPNTNAENAGATAPSAEGPNSRPATISPTTLGWPSRRATTAPSRAARMITINWTSRGRSSASPEAPSSVGQKAPAAPASGASAAKCMAANPGENMEWWG